MFAERILGGAMKPGYILSNAVLVSCAAMAVSAFSAAAENGIHDLVNARASGKFERIVWLSGPNNYSLQFVPLRPKATNAPANMTNPPPASGAPEAGQSSFFIGNTNANLRGLDPKFNFDPPRLLTLVDGRRIGAGQAGRPPAPRIQVWLLRADGTQILPTWNPTYKLYSVPAAEGVQAVAAAIQIDDEYYIDKLQPLEPMAPAQ